MPRMTGAKFMVQMMQAYGVTHAFYMPMVVTSVLPIHAAFRRRKSLLWKPFEFFR
jgi:thiamine pyrophosphate-dependent acetolactate synthase large subunit-like protein